MRFKLRETDEKNAAMEVMNNNEQYQKEPCVGLFWYDKSNDELFGVNSIPAIEARWYYSSQFNSTIRTDLRLHKNVWDKEFHKHKDPRFYNNYTKVPRGRVFEFEGLGFKVFTGSWINNYPNCKELIKYEFQLPEDTEFIQDSHWDIGHGWSDEF